MQPGRFHWLVPALVFFAAPASAQAMLVDERLLAPIERVVSPEPWPERDGVLTALRGLRDPSLRPLFANLMASSSPVMRRHGILGLAELESPPRLKAMLLSQIEDASEQAFILGEAIRQGLLPLNEIREMLRWEHASPMIEIVLRGHLASQGEAPDLKRLRQLAGAEDPGISLSAMLLLANGGVAGGNQALIAKLDSLPEGGRFATAALLIDQVRRDRLTGAAGVMPALHEIVRSEPRAAIESIRAWLTVDAAGAAPVLAAAYRDAAELSAKLRLALIALDSSSGAPVALFAPMMSEEKGGLVRALGELGHAVASGSDLTAAVERMAGFRYAPADAWMVERLPEIDAAAGAGAARAIIGAALDREREVRVGDAVATAAGLLAATDPQWLLVRVSAAAERRDTALCQALLAGILRAAPLPGAVPRDVAGWPDRTTGVLADIILARVEPESRNNPAVLRRLTEAGAGRSGLPTAIRVQAAWLAICGSGDQGEALARLLASGRP